MSDSKSFFLFNMTTGKKKLAYGSDAVDAYNILAYRLTPDEMKLVIRNEFVKVSQRDLQKVVPDLG